MCVSAVFLSKWNNQRVKYFLIYGSLFASFSLLIVIQCSRFTVHETILFNQIKMKRKKKSEINIKKAKTKAFYLHEIQQNRNFSIFIQFLPTFFLKFYFLFQFF